MQFNYTTKKCNIWDSTKEYTEKKLLKLGKFFSDDCTVYVIYTLEKDNNCKVEVTVEYNGITFRAQETTSDFKESVDRIVDVLIRQIRKHKTKLEKRLRNGSFDFDLGYTSLDESEDDYRIVRSKTVTAKPMSAEEAILQMNMIGHDFYVFRDESTEKVCVIYRRKSGNYGLIETD